MSPILEMLGDDLARGVFAAAAAATDGKLALHFEQGARAMIDGIANLTVTYCVADAHVHVSQPLFDSRTAPKRPSGGKY